MAIHRVLSSLNKNAQPLHRRRCVPCGGGTPRLKKTESQRFLRQIPGWRFLHGGQAIACDFRMKNFMAAVHFVNRIARVAEAVDHHPDLHLSGYRNLRIELSTHAIGGLSLNDFILASKIDRLPKEIKS